MEAMLLWSGASWLSSGDYSLCCGQEPTTRYTHRQMIIMKWLSTVKSGLALWFMELHSSKYKLTVIPWSIELISYHLEEYIKDIVHCLYTAAFQSHMWTCRVCCCNKTGFWWSVPMKLLKNLKLPRHVLHGMWWKGLIDIQQG